MSLVIERIQKKRLGLNYRRLESTFRGTKTQAYTMLILSLLTVSFFGFFALRPTLTTIAQLKRQIEDNQEVDKRLSDKINQLIAAQAEYETIASFVPKVKRALPEGHQYVQTLFDLNDIRVNSSASVSSVKIGEIAVDVVQPGLLDIKLEAEGEFISLTQIANRIMSNERLLTISEMDFSQAQILEGEGELDLLLDIEGPYEASRTGSARK